jgi:hypothetical protein
VLDLAVDRRANCYRRRPCAAGIALLRHSQWGRWTTTLPGVLSLSEITFPARVVPNILLQLLKEIDGMAQRSDAAHVPLSAGREGVAQCRPCRVPRRPFLCRCEAIGGASAKRARAPTATQTTATARWFCSFGAPSELQDKRVLTFSFIRCRRARDRSAQSSRAGRSPACAIPAASRSFTSRLVGMSSSAGSLHRNPVAGSRRC